MIIIPLINLKNIFISHYVQIKPSFAGCTCRTNWRFISHYVQIKRRWPKMEWCILLMIYIPLRSDKTFYFIFNSHYNRIYIPLRSDKTYSILQPPCEFWCIYIPLRSDKTHDHQPKHPLPCPIYIPLRSDKTWSISASVHFLALFISHYVQIKQDIEELKKAIDLHLYPTTFR